MTEKQAEQIRVAAYYIWEKEGRPEGKDEEIWFKACAQMANANKPAKKAVATKKNTNVVVKKENKPVTKVSAKPVVKKETKPVVKVVKAETKAKAKSTKKTKLATAKIKYNPIPVKTATTKIITPLYGSVKK